MKVIEKKVVIWAILLVFVCSDYGIHISPLLSEDSTLILFRRVKGLVTQQVPAQTFTWDSQMPEELKGLLAQLSGGVFPLQADESLITDIAEGEFSAQAELIESVVINALGWGSLSEEQQAILLFMCEGLIEAAISINVKNSTYSEGTLKDVAIPVLNEILNNIGALIPSIELLCGKSLGLKDPVAVSIIAPWLILAMDYQVRTKSTASQTMQYMQDMIDRVKSLGLDIDLTNVHDVGQAVAYANILSVAEQLPQEYEGLVANVVTWSMLYQVPQDYVLGLAKGAIQHKAVVERALASIGKSGDLVHIVPWLNVAMDRAIRENITIEQALKDVATIIEFMGEEGAQDIAANISEELEHPFDWTSAEDVSLLAGSIETILSIYKSAPELIPVGGPLQRTLTRFLENWSLSPRTLNIIRDVLALIYAGANLINYTGDTSSVLHAVSDSMILWFIVRPIIDMGLLVLQRQVQSFFVEDGTSPSMGDEPKKSFYAQFFGRLPEWIEGNVKFLKDEWLPRTDAYKLYKRLSPSITQQGAEEGDKPELATPGKRTITNILRMAYIPPLFGMYILNHLAGSAAGTLAPTSSLLGYVLFGTAVFGGIVLLGKFLGPLVSRRHTFEDRSLTSFIAGLGDSMLELLLSTALLMPMVYYLPMFHLRALRNQRQQKLEGKVPERTPGWLVSAKWQLDGLAQSYRIQVPTVAIGGALGAGLAVFNPYTALISLPIWGGLLVSPLIAYFSEPKP